MDNTSAHINYRDLIPRQNGFVFKFIKEGDHFVHTYAEGDFHEKIGIPVSFAIGKTLFDFLPKEQALQKLKFYEEAWRGKTVNYEGCINDYYYIASLTPLIIDSRVVEVNGTAIDITAEKKNELRIREMDKLSVIGQMAAGIAHEIRNPLTSIKGFAQMIREKVIQEDLKVYVNIMLDELERVNYIVNEFMALSKPHETMNLKETNIHQLIANVIQFIEPQTLLKGIRMSAAFNSSIIASIDANQIKQVLINLLQNAIESSGHECTFINISLKELNGSRFMIQVEDNGPGMSLETQNRLFEPFFTTKETGTGLGLLVCKQIIEAHRGTIEIESSPGQGTSVTIILPK